MRRTDWRKYPFVEFQDWFVPVTYSSAEDVQLKHNSGLHHSLTAVVHTVIPWNGTQTQPISSADRGLPKPESSWVSLDILRCERDLLAHRGYVFLHGPEKSGKTRLAEYLRRSWLATSFVEQVVIIGASSYIRAWPWRVLRYDQGNKKSEWFWPSAEALGVSDYDLWNVQTVIFICYIDQIFPSERAPTEEETEGQTKFGNCLRMIFSRIERDMRRPYLIIIGNDKSLWRAHLTFPYFRGGEVQRDRR